MSSTNAAEVAEFMRLGMAAPRLHDAIDRATLRFRALTQLAVEQFNAHDHHSHHVHGYYAWPGGEWVEHTPEQKARWLAEWDAWQRRRWRKRYREILRELRSAP